MTLLWKRKLLAALALSVASAGFCATASAATMQVGSTPTGAPFTFLDVKTQTIQGAMVDVVQAISKVAGFQVQIDSMSFSALISALTSKRIDIISAAMFATPVRAQVVAFSAPVYSYGEGLLVSDSDKHNYVSFADMKGMTIGAQLGTTFVDMAQKSGDFKEIKTYDNSTDMAADLRAGRIQAAVFDYPIMSYNFAQGKYPGTRIVTSYKPVNMGDVALAVRKDDPETLKKIDDAIAKLKADGTIQAIFKKWGIAQ